MHYLVVDDRFGTPIYVILEADPRDDVTFPGLPVQVISFLPRAGSPASGMPAGRMLGAMGRDPEHLNHFQEFGSDGAVSGARFILIEPRYVGPSWQSYLSAFRPGGEKPDIRSRHAARPPSS